MITDAAPLPWLSPPAALELKPGQVDVWRAHLKMDTDALESLKSILSSEERKRAGRFHFPADRERYIAAHGCLRDILRRYLGCEPTRLRFSTGAYGKPAVIMKDGSQNLEFNLSHSGAWALIAVARASRVGVDLERIRQGISTEELAGRFFSPSEVWELGTLPPEQKRLAFFNGWTRKEAYIKARGLGLSLPLDSFDVSLDPGRPARLLATRPDVSESSRWTLQELAVESGYAAALVSEGKIVSLNLWKWTLDGRT